jgi:hypothetical protein
MLRHAQVAVTAAHYVEIKARPVPGLRTSVDERGADHCPDRGRKIGHLRARRSRLIVSVLAFRRLRVSSASALISAPVAGRRRWPSSPSRVSLQYDRWKGGKKITPAHAVGGSWRRAEIQVDSLSNHHRNFCNEEADSGSCLLIGGRQAPPLTSFPARR